MITATSFGQAKFNDWPEMRTFNSILAETFHPAEEGDLKPIKSRSHELFQNAKLINISPMPEKYDNEAVRKMVKKLVKETDKLNALIVRDEQSTAVMKQLNVVHDTYHEIAGMCKKEEK
ncbi:hypothetical protein GCM10023093_03880 [Nemorincola caseinilytica]|uniref:Uncharacterized protein n=1 Tax=Nemorincola caseinilytica TaxID=2054315 RepID=A0ABP8N6M8_9BACT